MAKAKARKVQGGQAKGNALKKAGLGRGRSTYSKAIVKGKTTMPKGAKGARGGGEGGGGGGG